MDILDTKSVFTLDDPSFWQEYETWLRNGEPYDHQKDEELIDRLERGRTPPVELDTCIEQMAA